MGPTGSLVAEGLTNLAGNSVHLVHVGRAELAGARAVLGQVALVLREPEIFLLIEIFYVLMVLSGDKKYFEINNRTILGFTDCGDKTSLKLRDGT